MRNLHTNATATHKENSQVGRLETIHRLINGRTFQPELIEEKLSKINSDYLTPYCLVYFKYLNVRHHFNCYKQEDAIEHLELACDLLDDMDTTAYEQSVKICNDEYHFTRAYVRFVLSTLYFDEFETPWMLSKVRRITDNAVNYNPHNLKFVWLQKQLVA